MPDHIDDVLFLEQPQQVVAERDAKNNGSKPNVAEHFELICHFNSAVMSWCASSGIFNCCLKPIGSENGPRRDKGKNEENFRMKSL